MLVQVYDKRGNEVVVNAKPQYITIPIYIPETDGEYLNCDWYTFEDFQGDSSQVEPFVYFCNGSFGLFCNDINETNFESLSRYGQILAKEYYYELMINRHYSKDFSTFLIYKTTDETDDDTTYIDWVLSDEEDDYSYSWGDGGKKLTFYTNGQRSRASIFTEWLMQLFEERYQLYVETVADNMKLLDKILECKFEDPTTLIYANPEHTRTTTCVSVGTHGTNYHKDVFSQYETEYYEDDKKSTIKYSPFVFLMEPKQQKILLVHELVHTKIGYAHKHDAYFWYLLQEYSGLKKDLDGAYQDVIEARDTKEYDSSHPNLTCADLIRRHKAWKANGKKGQW